jgi:NAD(P)-dependent dehydrogenase (short-subunit alcohol dehydrogenase family)
MQLVLDNKVALVAGGSSGIGRASAIAMARAGAKVVIAARRIEPGNETVEIIRRAGGEASFVQADLTRASAVEALVTRAVELHGRVDCAFNNVGRAGDFVPLAEVSEELYDDMMTTNVKSIWLCMKYQILQMLEQGGGSIVNMSSVTGKVGHFNAPTYSASKHAVIGLTRSAALAYGTRGVRVNAVCPTAIVGTPMIDLSLRDAPEAMAAFAAQIPIGRMGTTEEVANAVVWLCSDASSLVTGGALNLDGGALAQ